MPGSSPAAARIAAFVDRTPEMNGAAFPAPFLPIDHVYAGSLWRTVRVERGSITAIVGPNGAGKTSLLKAVCGLQPLRSGQIRIDVGEHRDELLAIKAGALSFETLPLRERS